MQNINATAGIAGSNSDAIPTILHPAEEWVRLPKPKARWMGLSRTTWNEILDSGAVRSITLKKRGARRGIRLIHAPSALAHFDTLAAN